ncbi:Pyridoxal phosphate (PLP)-dependent transferases superfamily protein [Thalictrum thalictroides]|uniref:Pyridoxal phosphate (PLP)-dependent transferases superfamily protein n=1 Tax=Thalictrum thalictroides TaxID=46969 RepID=A0A7J6WUP3_THATH|nr:Pyridoxal phosphate (PLP)-dependent transferases superfamily protein [Thalictrum thalictroides]
MMQSACVREVSEACFQGCCKNPILGLSETPDPKSKFPTTVAASRAEFAAATASSLSPETQLTDHESLPSLPESWSRFKKAYPQYRMTDHADSIRAHDYSHLSLSNHVCLDYIGHGLFSYSQQSQFPSTTAVASSSSSPPPMHRTSELPFFDVCYKSASLKSQVLYGGQDSELESTIRKRIMAYLNICEDDYSMVFTANRTSAFKLLAESYPFQSNKRLLTVYDYESEAVRSMIDNSQKRGAKVLTAEYSWPSMRVQSTKLRKMVVNKRKKKDRGLFVFPLQSKMTGTRYSYLWMTLAQANGWHVVLDACALGPKDMDTLGLSLIRPDFLICSFYKIFGENPSGFGCFFVKKSNAKVLESSTIARSIGIASLVPLRKTSQILSNSSDTESETKGVVEVVPNKDDDLASTRSRSRSFSGPMSSQVEDGLNQRSLRLTRRELEESEISELPETEVKVEAEIVEVYSPNNSVKQENTIPNTSSSSRTDRNLVIECRGLDHADSLGLIKINNRARCLINWLVNALSKLQHPHSEQGLPLVRIYGPKVKLDRGPAVAFNVFDWKGEKVEPVLVQKLADRSNISLSYGFLHNLWFSDKYEEEKQRVLETRYCEAVKKPNNKRKEKVNKGINVVTATLSFLTNFEDVYRLWLFVAQFLDADFVEKERWRYMALNQNIVEV